MADVDVKIVNLPADTTQALGNFFPVTDGTTTYKLSLQQLLTLFTVSGNIIKSNEVITTSATMAKNQGYIANNAAPVELTLPASSSVGDIIEVNGKGAGGWIIKQIALQQIHIGASASTLGVGGSVASGAQFDSVRIKCIVANTIWASLGAPQGTLTIV